MSAPRPFVFGDDRSLPHHDLDAGVAFGKAGMRGVYQVGVVHAFVLSGYYPTTVAGTSSGALAGTVLAAAGAKPDPESAMQVVADFVAAWLDDPGQKVFDRLLDPTGGPRRLARDAVDTGLSLGRIAELGGRVLRDDRTHRAMLRLGLSLPWRRLSVWRLAARVAAAAAVGLVRGDLRLRLTQAVLTAYGMRHGLLDASMVDLGFSDAIAAHAPRHLGDFAHTHLVFQATDVSGPEGTVVELHGKEALLEPALRAAWAIPPLFRPVDAGRVQPGRKGVFVDAAGVEKAPLLPILRRWREAEGASTGRRRLFAVYTNPVASRPKGARLAEGFVGPALLALQLSGQRDLEFNAKLVRLITSMLDALPEDTPRPTTEEGTPFVPVDVTGVAPRDLLPLGAMDVPRPAALDGALSAGCRAGLVALHSDRLRALGGTHEESVACDRLLERLRADYAHAPAGLFEPAAAVCATCDAKLYTVEDREEIPDQRPGGHFEPFTEAARPDPDSRLTVAVASGGVFKGVFQAGVIAALIDYGVRPQLYAGASVGTIFSYFLDASLRSAEAYDEVLDLMRRLDEWIDADDRGGRVDLLHRALLDRWRVSPLRALTPRVLWDALGDPTPDPVVEPALRALLFTPLRDRITGEVREGLLPPPTWSELRAGAMALARLRFEEAVPLTDTLAMHLDLFDADEAEHGELVGLDNVKAAVGGLVFGGGNPTLPEWATERKTRFLFTVTNHTDGRLEHFGSVDSSGVEKPVYALEACLAASSFPIAFRRRRERELVKGSTRDRPLYADGGILNNFPSDSAFEYLRRLSALDEHAWLGDVEHRVLLLALQAGRKPPKGPGDHCLVAAARTYASGDREKLERTQAAQGAVNRIALLANPSLRARNLEQGIRATFVRIEPSYEVYRHAFAFKPYLGFREDKQLEMIATGCRRARVALEAELGRDIDRRVPRRCRRSGPECVLPTERACPFAASEAHARVQDACYATAWKDHRSA